MVDEKEREIPIASMDTTIGLVSAMQLVDTTPSEIFVTPRNETSDTEILRMIYPSVELPML